MVRERNITGSIVIMEQNDHEWLLAYEEYYNLVMEIWHESKG